MRRGAGQHLSAFVQRVIEQLQHLVARLAVDQRADLHAGFEAVADLQRRHAGDKLLGELRVNAALHVEPIDADAGLPGVAVFGDQRAFHRGIDVRIVKHDERRVAAQPSDTF